MLYWMLKRVFLGPLLRVLFRPKVEGLEHIPAEGPAILASNHLSFSDSIFLPLVIDRWLTFLAKSDYFTGPGLKGWLTAAFFRGVGQLPIDRSGGKASEAALNAGLRVLDTGDLLGVLPLEMMHERGAELDVLQPASDLAQRVVDRLAVLGRDDAGELLGPPLGGPLLVQAGLLQLALVVVAQPVEGAAPGAVAPPWSPRRSTRCSPRSPATARSPAPARRCRARGRRRPPPGPPTACPRF